VPGAARGAIEMEAAYLKVYVDYRLNACETKESRMRCASYVHASHVVTPLARCVRDKEGPPNYGRERSYIDSRASLQQCDRFLFWRSREPSLVSR
jgi:hypothetical protein